MKSNHSQVEINIYSFTNIVIGSLFFPYALIIFSMNYDFYQLLSLFIKKSLFYEINYTCTNKV
jgi:hypothetical protein